LNYLLLLLLIYNIESYFEWKYHSQISVNVSHSLYDKTNVIIQGRGYQTLFTRGLTSNSSNIFIYSSTDSFQWIQRNKLTQIERNNKLSDEFGKQFVLSDTTLLVTSPYYTPGKLINVGALYVFSCSGVI